MTANDNRHPRQADQQTSTKTTKMLLEQQTPRTALRTGAWRASRKTVQHICGRQSMTTRCWPNTSRWHLSAWNRLWRGAQRVSLPGPVVRRKCTLWLPQPQFLSPQCGEIQYNYNIKHFNEEFWQYKCICFERWWMQ